MDTKVADEIAAELNVPADKFLGVADTVIGFANHSSTEMRKDGVHLAFLYAIARYGVFDWQNGPKNEDQEAFIAKMIKRYEAMLREQLGDTKLKDRPASP
ncbi:MAG: DUF3144 domain-containing protein [Alphaproteobacteria bacterium]